MFAPLRSVMAAQQSHCDMEDMSTEEMSVSMHASKSHDMSKMSSMDMSAWLAASEQTAAEPATSQPTISEQAAEQAAVNQQCCCCDDNCVSNCDMGLSVSILIHASSYTPVFINTAVSTTPSLNVLARALTPPSRPPAYLS